MASTFYIYYLKIFQRIKRILRKKEKKKESSGACHCQSKSYKSLLLLHISFSQHSLPPASHFLPTELLMAPPSSLPSPPALSALLLPAWVFSDRLSASSSLLPPTVDSCSLSCSKPLPLNLSLHPYITSQSAVVVSGSSRQTVNSLRARKRPLWETSRG